MSFPAKDKTLGRNGFGNFWVSFLRKNVNDIEYGFCLYPVNKDK